MLTVNVDGGSSNKAGQLPVSLAFSTDHRGMYADFNAENLLGLAMEEPELREGHGSSLAQGLTGLGGSVPLAQSAGALHNARSAAEAVPVDMLDSVDSLEDVSRSIDAADQVRQLHEEANADLTTKAVEYVRASA